MMVKCRLAECFDHVVMGVVENLAVIAHHDDDRASIEPEPRQLVQHAADVIVGIGRLGQVRA